MIKEQIRFANQLLENGNIEKSLRIFKKILHENPDSKEAQQGFTKAYTALLENDRMPEEAITDSQEIKVLFLQIKRLEAMRRVVHERLKRKPSPRE